MPIAWIALTLIAALTPLPPAAPVAAPFAPGVIRGRVDVRVERGLRDARPDPGALGMSHARDPLERRSSVVYLETAPRAAFEPGEDRRARLDQRNERFVPHVLAIVAGTWVDFPNGDRTYHNVFSLSKDNAFNLGRYASGRSRAVRFDRPGIVREISTSLADRGASIEDLHTELADSDDGTRMFRLTALLYAPAALTDAALHEALDPLAKGMRMDLALGERNTLSAQRPPA